MFVGIAIHYPIFVSHYHISKLLGSLNQCDENQRLLRLKIIGRRLEHSSDIVQEISDFQIVEWYRLLEDANLEIQINTLDIIKKAVENFMKMKCFPEIMKSLSRNVQHPNEVFRSCLYDTAFQIYEQSTLHTEAAKNILIVGLVDSVEDNKSKVVNIWNEKMNLPAQITDRFSYILNELYVPKTEEMFLGFANYFLIGLIGSDEKFNDLLFEHPLEDCNFEDYELQTNWRLQHPSVVPLFAETFQTFDPSAVTNNNVFQLRQTQASLNFTPTQDQHLKTHTSLDSSLAVNFSSEPMFKNPNSLNLSKKYRYRKRFLEDKKKISRQFAHYEIKKKIQKSEKRIEMAKEREKKVAIYRSYRKGDFPDIQIALSAVLTPLQMLALVSIFSVLFNLNINL